MEFNDLYSEKILEIAARLPQTVRLADPDASARRVSRVCGSVIEVDLKLEDGRVSAYAHEVSACAMGQTAASVMADKVIGSTPDELRTVRTQMYAMLKGEGMTPSGRWDDLKYLQPVRDYPARHTSTLLVFDAVVDCLDAIEGRSAAE